LNGVEIRRLLAIGLLFLAGGCAPGVSGGERVQAGERELRSYCEIARRSDLHTWVGPIATLCVAPEGEREDLESPDGIECRAVRVLSLIHI